MGIQEKREKFRIRTSEEPQLKWWFNHPTVEPSLLRWDQVCSKEHWVAWDDYFFYYNELVWTLHGTEKKDTFAKLLDELKRWGHRGNSPDFVNPAKTVMVWAQWRVIDSSSELWLDKYQECIDQSEHVTPMHLLVLREAKSLVPGIVTEVQNLQSWMSIVEVIIPAVLPYIIDKLSKKDPSNILAAIVLKKNDKQGGASTTQVNRVLSVARSMRNSNASLRLLRTQVPFEWEEWREWDVPEDLDDVDDRLGKVKGDSELLLIVRELVKHFNNHRAFVNFVIDHFTKHYGLEKKGQPASVGEVIVRGKTLDELIDELEKLTSDVRSSFSPVGKALMLRKSAFSPLESELKATHKIFCDMFHRCDVLKKVLGRKRGLRIFGGKIKEAAPEYNATDWLDQMSSFLANNWSVLVSLVISLLGALKIDIDVPEIDFVDKNDVAVVKMVNSSTMFLDQAICRVERKLAAEGESEVVPNPPMYVWPFSDFEKAEFERFINEDFKSLIKRVVTLETASGLRPDGDQHIVGNIKKYLFGNFTDVEIASAILEISGLHLVFVSLKKDVALMSNEIYGQDGIPIETRSVVGMVRTLDMFKVAVNENTAGLANLQHNFVQLANRVASIEQRSFPVPNPNPVPSGNQVPVDYEYIKQRLSSVEQRCQKIDILANTVEMFPNVYANKSSVDTMASEFDGVKMKVNALYSADLVNEVNKISLKLKTLDNIDFAGIERKLGGMDGRIKNIENYDINGMSSKIAQLEERPSWTSKQIESIQSMIGEFPKIKTLLVKVIRYINQWGGGKSFEGEFEPLDEQSLQRSRGQAWYSDWAFAANKKKVIEERRRILDEAIRKRDYVLLFDTLGIGFFDLECARIPGIVELYHEVNQSISRYGSLIAREKDAFLVRLAEFMEAEKDMVMDIECVSKCQSFCESCDFEGFPQNEDCNEDNGGYEDVFYDSVAYFVDVDNGSEFEITEILDGVSACQNDPVVDGVASQSVVVPLHTKMLVPENPFDVHCTIGEELGLFDNRESVLKNLHPTACVIAGGREAYPLSKTEGDILWKFPISGLRKARGPFAAQFNNFGVIPGGLSVTIRMNLSPLTGVGLALAYFESGLSLAKVIPAELLPHPHVAWNPACEDAKTFIFQPFSCCQSWHPNLTLLHEGVVALVQISSWGKALAAPFHFSWTVSYADKLDQIENIVNPLNLPRTLNLRAHIGEVTFAVNNLSPLRRMELDPCKPMISPVGVYYSLWQNLLGSVGYWRSDILFEVIRTSSPMVSMSLAMAVCPGTRSEVEKPGDLLAVPHVEFTMGAKESRKVVKFPSHLFGYHMAGDIYSFVGGPTSMIGLTLFLWSLDSPTSPDSSGFSVQVAVCGLTNLETRGTTAGNLPYGKRTVMDNVEKVSKYSLRGTRWMIPPLMLEMGYHNLPEQSKGQNAQVWHQSWYWSPWGFNNNSNNGVPPVINSPDTPVMPVITDKRIQFTLNAYKPDILEGPSGQVANHFIVASPTVRVLNSCVWFKGTLLYRFVWSGKYDIKSGDWMGFVKIAVHGEHAYSLRKHLFISSDKSGVHEFAVDVVGPVDGFYNMEAMLEYAASPSVITVCIGCPKQFDYCEMYVAFGNNCAVTGTGASIIGPVVPGTRAAGFTIVS